MSSVTMAAPPTARDFEMHRSYRVEHVSTYRLAERFAISQTRVRQVVQRVSRWLASTLPLPSDLELEQETRLARHLAADQLQAQIEELQTFWDQTRDPKYLRQQTRTILALARLGVVPGAIDAAAADAEQTQQELPTAESDGLARTNALNANDTPRPATAHSPNGDCSPADSETQNGCAPQSESVVATAGDNASSEWEASRLNESREGLNLIERRLLTLLANTPADDQKGRQGLEQTLTTVRSEQAALEVRLSPDKVAVQVFPPGSDEAGAVDNRAEPRNYPALAGLQNY